MNTMRYHFLMCMILAWSNYWMKTVNVEEREMQNVSENSLDLINQGCALMAQQQYEQALAKFLLAQKDSPKYIDC